MNDNITEKQARDNAIDALGLTMTAVFVPWSQSRSKVVDPKLRDYSLNWNITLSAKGREFLTFTYTAGIANCATRPRHWAKPTIGEASKVIAECEGRLPAFRGKPKPNLHNVINSLLSDANAIEHGSFEDWGRDLGYDTDSRKAESMYRACLECGLKLRQAIGDEGITQLRTAFQDY
jgi:hypothetical protein